MSAVTIWMIVLLSSSGTRVELPNPYNSERECTAALQAIQQSQPGTGGGCVGTLLEATDERAKQAIEAEWWRSQQTAPPPTK